MVHSILKYKKNIYNLCTSNLLQYIALFSGTNILLNEYNKGKES